MCDRVPEREHTEGKEPGMDAGKKGIIPTRKGSPGEIKEKKVMENVLNSFPMTYYDPS